MTQTETNSTAKEKPAAGPGRPRNFDEAAVLEAAMTVFWHNGFEATSLDDLTEAMGLSRSSFYSTFGCKQSLFLRALEHYSRNGIRALKEIAENAEGSPVDALMQALSNPDGGSHGCMLVNCITELAPHDQKVADIGRRHLDNIEEVFATAIDPQNPGKVRDQASAYYSLAIGTLALRKAGVPAERIANTLKQAKSILPS